MTDPELLAKSANPHVDYAKYVRMLHRWDASDGRKLEMVRQLEVMVQSAFDAFCPEDGPVPMAGSKHVRP